MRFAIVGCGVIGRAHAAALDSLAGRAEVTATVSSRIESAKALAQEHDATAFPSLDAALDGGTVDAVTVCTPSGLHADAAVAALRGGRHTVIEKPLDVSLEAAARVCSAARESGATATVVSQHRFDPASVAVKQAIGTGRLGRLTSAAVTVPLWRPQSYYESAAWRGTSALDGGGALLNQGIHQIDLLLWLMGRPVTVSAEIATIAHDGIEVEDTATATVRFESGALATIHATTAAYPGLPARVQVHGDRGTAVIERDRLVYFHADDTDGPTTDNGRAARNQAGDLLPGGGDPGTNVEALARQYAEFLGAVEEGRRPLVSLAEAMRSLAVVRACYTSAAAGQPVSVADRAGTQEGC